MINILSYAGINLQSEVCLWCLLGLVRTIFDATLFKVNANLKQVWQMNMPVELSMPVQRVLRTMVSGVMLVQCFTVYVYLASYIVLLYPVFLEERPALVLPWLLLAAVRKLLCELTSLALGLGTCLLLGPARPPCIKFVVVKFATIIPAFYTWMLVFSYYHALKVAAAFKTFPAMLPPNENDYGLELAVRRRCTKSLLGEEQLRKKLVANFYGERTPSTINETFLRPAIETISGLVVSIDASIEEDEPEADVLKPSTAGLSDIGAYVYEDWFGSEVMIPRDTDRILEQIVLMLLRIGVYLKKEGSEPMVDSQILNSANPTSSWLQQESIDCAAINGDTTEPPPHVGSSRGNVASYLREYPQIFMKKQGQGLSQTELTFATLKTVHSHVETDENTTSKSKVKQDSPSNTSYGKISSEVERVSSKRKITISDSNTTPEDKTIKLALPKDMHTKRTTKEQIKIILKKQRDSERESEKYTGEIIDKVLDDLQESKTFTKIETSKENNKTESTLEKNTTVEESSQTIKQITTDFSKRGSDITVLDETNKEESALSQILNVRNNDHYNILSGEENEFKRKESNDSIIMKEAPNEEILLQNTNRVSSNSKMISVTSHEKFTYDDKNSKAGTSSKIPKENNNKKLNSQVSNDNSVIEPSGENISKENSYSGLNKNIIENSDISNFSKKEFLQEKASQTELPKMKNCKTVIKQELPLRILSNDDSFRNSLGVKVSNDDSSDTNTSRKAKNKGSSDDEIANEGEESKKSSK